jgi:maltooligosyltrehalose trehalohydrolase
VNLYAPAHVYGTPDDLRRLVDEAHRVGLGVILDVVYNHVGPDGNYLTQFADDYFTTRYKNEWGEPFNFDGENSAPVREWVTTNAAYWAAEYHFDGLRLDATQQIFDVSPENIMTSLAKSMRAAALPRKVFIVGENEAQCSKLARPCEQGGYGLDGLWNDDFHHSAQVAMTGRAEAYYSDYRGKAQEFVSSAKYGFLFQGQRYSWQAKRRGSPAWGLRPEQFVTFIQNHDQIANSGRGERIHQLTGPSLYRAVTAFLLLAPGTPMLFQGQEFAASSPFFFFADHTDELRRLVWEGRIQFLAQFPSLAQPDVRPYHVDPGDPASFEKCKLDLSERQSHAGIYQLHKDLLRLRKEDPIFHEQRAGGLDGAVLGGEAFLLRYFGGSSHPGGDRLLLVNLGVDLKLDPAPEPLLAPLDDQLWELMWSSEDPRYGGAGTAPLDNGEGWIIPGRAAVVMRPGAPKDQWQI